MAFSMNTRKKIGTHIHDRTAFTHESMSGRWVTSGSDLGSWGRLPQETRRIMTELLKDRDLYVVWSFFTPIAYGYDRDMIVPDHRYSQNTTHHQNIVRLAQHYATI